MTIVSIPVTSAFALPLTFIIIFLAMQVVRFRKKHKVGFGSNKNEELSRAIGAHANAIENIPLALFLLLMLELNQLDQVYLIVFGGILVIARLIHAFGLTKSIGVSFGRTYGTLITWILMLTMSGLNLFLISV